MKIFASAVLSLTLLGTVAASAQQTGTYQGVPVVVVPTGNPQQVADPSYARRYAEIQEENRQRAAAQAQASAAAAQERQREAYENRGTATTYTTNPYTGTTTAVTKPNQY